MTKFVSYKFMIYYVHSKYEQKSITDHNISWQRICTFWRNFAYLCHRHFLSCNKSNRNIDESWEIFVINYFTKTI